MTESDLRRGGYVGIQGRLPKPDMEVQTDREIKSCRINGLPIRREYATGHSWTAGVNLQPKRFGKCRHLRSSGIRQASPGQEPFRAGETGAPEHCRTKRPIGMDSVGISPITQQILPWFALVPLLRASGIQFGGAQSLRI